jgi:hypothetical protein
MNVDATGDITINADEHGYVNSIDVHIITKGKNEIVAEAKKIAAKYKGRCNLKISRPYSPRSTGPRSQESHIRGHEADILSQSKQGDWTMEEVHQLMKALTVAAGRDFPYKKYRGIMIYASNAEINSLQANNELETIHQFADENGMWLTEYIDEFEGDTRIYRSIGGRLYKKMLEDFPTMEVLIDQEAKREEEKKIEKAIIEKQKEELANLQPTIICPKCKYEGTSQYCPACRYCSHEYIDGKCGLCGAGEPIEPVKIDTAKFKEKGDLY